MKLKPRLLTHVAMTLFAFSLTGTIRADEVLDWNAVLRQAVLAAPGAPGARLSAIVQASVFDAVNGIERRYTPIHVAAEAPRGASVRAAAVQAAYTSLIELFPAQSSLFEQQLATSLAGIASESAVRHSKSIARGRAWGEQVANEILAWRSTDGWDPSPSTYTGSLLPGKWRPTPPGFLNGAFPSLPHTLPWVIPSPTSFRPAGPPALTDRKSVV